MTKYVNSDVVDYFLDWSKMLHELNQMISIAMNSGRFFVLDTDNYRFLNLSASHSSFSVRQAVERINESWGQC